MTMQKRHFEIIAEAIASLPPTCTREDVAVTFANVLEDTNKGFDRERFKAACEPTRGEGG